MGIVFFESLCAHVCDMVGSGSAYPCDSSLTSGITSQTVSVHQSDGSSEGRARQMGTDDRRESDGRVYHSFVQCGP